MLKIANNVLISTGCVTNVPFWELVSNFGILKQASKNTP